MRWTSCNCTALVLPHTLSTSTFPLMLLPPPREPTLPSGSLVLKVLMIDDPTARDKQRAAMRAVRAKLSPELVLEMFELRAAGWTAQALGDKFGVNRTTVSRALRGNRWPDVRAGIKNPPPILSHATAVRAARAKLSAEQVRSVHRMAAEGMTQRAIAATVGVTRPAVGYILRGETFRDIWLEFNPNTPRACKAASKRHAKRRP